jgi:hypothetical protein
VREQSSNQVIQKQSVSQSFDLVFILNRKPKHDLWLHNKVVWPFRERQPATPADNPLRGAPKRPRLRTYSGNCGYVYQYVFRGTREAADEDTEFVFSISRDRKNWQFVSILLSAAVLRDWEAISERPVIPPERYALAKLALFEYFDEQSGNLTPRVNIAPSDIGRHLATLGRL